MNYQDVNILQKKHYPVCTKKKLYVHPHITCVCFSAFSPIILVKLYSVYFTLHLYILFSAVFKDFGLYTLVGSQQTSCQSYNWFDWYQSCHLEGPLEQLHRGCIAENFHTDYLLEKTYWLDWSHYVRNTFLLISWTLYQRIFIYAPLFFDHNLHLVSKMEHRYSHSTRTALNSNVFMWHLGCACPCVYVRLYWCLG